MGFITDPGMTTVRDHGTLGASLGHGAGGTTFTKGTSLAVSLVKKTRNRRRPLSRCRSYNPALHEHLQGGNPADSAFRDRPSLGSSVDIDLRFQFRLDRKRRHGWIRRQWNKHHEQQVRSNLSFTTMYRGSSRCLHLSGPVGSPSPCSGRWVSTRW